DLPQTAQGQAAAALGKGVEQIAGQEDHREKQYAFVHHAGEAAPSAGYGGGKTRVEGDGMLHGKKTGRWRLGAQLGRIPLLSCINAALCRPGPDGKKAAIAAFFSGRVHPAWPPK